MTESRGTGIHSALARIVETAIKSADAEQGLLDPLDPASANPAVAYCCKAYETALEAARKKGMSEFKISNAACQAYRKALPPLSGAANIRDFIACVTHGMLIEAVSSSLAPKLLYAAQVAQTALEKPLPRSVGRPSSTPLPEN